MLFGKKKPPDDETQWVLRQDSKDYPAADFRTVGQWIIEGRAVFGSEIYDPETHDWRKPEQYLDRALSGVLLTTTPTVDGYSVEKYIGVESVEFVIGTGVFSEFGGDIADFFGQRSTAFEQKMQAAKHSALQKLRLIAAQKGGNAVIGIDLDYTEFSGNRVGIIANGTVVKLTQLMQGA